MWRPVGPSASRFWCGKARSSCRPSSGGRLFPWLILGADFDNDSAFMNDVVVPWCRTRNIEVTRSRAYKKNDQAFVEQKNGAVVRRLVGYGRFDGVETARVDRKSVV